MQIRKRLVDRNAPTFYLGDPARTFKYKVVWKRVGNGHKLVIKQSATAVIKAEEPQQGSDSDYSADVTSMTQIDAFLEPVILSAIVFIDVDDCWLAPCGYWKGPTNATKKFEDLKLSFHGKAPTREFLSQDFSTIVQNAKSLMDDTNILGGAKSAGFLVTTKKGEIAIQLRHVVFEVHFLGTNYLLLIRSTEARPHIRWCF